MAGSWVRVLFLVLPHPTCYLPDSFAGGLITGIALLTTWVVSVGGIVQKNHVTTGLVITNWMLVLDSIIILIFGTILWFFSLQQRANYQVVYNAVSRETRLAIQDKVRLSHEMIEMRD